MTKEEIRRQIAELEKQLTQEGAGGDPMLSHSEHLAIRGRTLRDLADLRARLEALERDGE